LDASLTHGEGDGSLTISSTTNDVLLKPASSVDAHGHVTVLKSVSVGPAAACTEALRGALAVLDGKTSVCMYFGSTLAWRSLGTDVPTLPPL